MTSDAKIGLLLGLVFIFVIAFIINGLPNLRPQQATGANVSTEVSFPNNDMGVTGKVQEAQENLDGWNGLADAQEPAVETAVEAVETAVEPPDAAVETPLPQPEVAISPDVRYVSPLPTRIEALWEHLKAGLPDQREPASTVNMNVPMPPAEKPAVSERQAGVQTPQPKPAETVTRNAEQPRPAATLPAKPAGKIYVVKDGESLSAVAKSVYGLEEGNKIANVERIFQANRDVLPSIDQVKAGQQLVIPPVPQAALLNPDKPSDVLSRELFEKVNSIGKRAAAQMPAPSVESRWYTIQDGDSLWKIARTQLGAGARYEEIRQFNADILKDGSPLPLGMKIRLPLK